MSNKAPPSEADLEKFFEKDVICWKKAVQMVEEKRAKKQKRKPNKLKKKPNPSGSSEPDSSKSITDPDNAQQSTAVTAQELIQIAQTAHANSSKQRGTAKDIFYKIVFYFERHSQVIDVFIQQEPKFTAIVWGSIRYLLWVIVDYEQASEVTAEGILLVVQQAERWSRMARCYGHQQSVENATVYLYVQVLEFLQSATERFGQGKWARLEASLINSVRDEFAAKIVKLQDAADRLDRAANWESNEDNKQANKEILKILRTPETPQARAAIMTEALSAFEAKKGELQMDLDITKIHHCINELASPIACRPSGLGATATDSQPEWLTMKSAYQRWLADASPDPLWIVGKPGVGKSTLAHQIRSTLSKTQHTIVTHAFQSNVSTQKRDRASLAISILSQLLPPCYPVSSFQKEIFAQLLPSYNQYKSRFEDCPFEQLWPHCVTLLQSQEDFILIIDALDECRFDHRGQAKEILESLTQVLDCTGGKVVIFSRPNDMFGVGTSSKIHINEIRITEQDTLPEITAFCNSASAKLDLPEEMKLRVASRAKRHADSFLWPAQFLQEFTKTRKMSTLQKILEEYPSDIWSVYTRIWKDRLSKLDEVDKSICRDIFLMLLGARREFDVTELEDALHLIPDSGTAQFIISQHCQPLVEVLDGGVRLSHASVRDFLLNEGISGGGLSMSEPDATLARKCLEFLLKDIYASKDRIGQRLRKNIEVGGSANNQEKSFYEYAARYWYIHLTALLPPTQSLLELAGRFLRSLQFAYWAEYSITDMGDFEAIRSTEITLTVWLQRLPHNDRPLLHLDDYFETPYKNLSREFEENQGDKVLQWMALIQLGFYYFDKGRMTEMADVRKNVATGLTQLLGRRNPLTLRALSDAAYTFLFNNELHKARRLYAGVAADQREVVGESDPSPYFTLVYQSQAEHLMLDSSAALSTLTDSLAGFIRTTGPQSNGSLIAQLWYAVANASAGQIEQAIKMMEFVRDKRREQYGPEDSFGIATQIFMGDLYRKLGDEEKALENIEPALRFRRGFWPISHFMTLDTALILAITYRDFGNDDEAAEIIQELEEHARLDCDQNFVRACQVKHLRALLLFEDGNLNQPIRLLETLLIETNEAHNNRALQWVRLDLAYMLRYRGGEGDEGLASSLFHGIVTDQTHDPDDEPDPPRWLEAAEGALKLLRLGNTQGAKDLLEKEKLHWAREETLWMWLGVPAADTGWMRLPKGLGDDNM